jgi:hypothetical protein
MKQKKLILSLIAILIFGFLITSGDNIKTLGLSLQANGQDICSVASDSCDVTDSTSTAIDDPAITILAYLMIIMGISLLVINWRITALETIRLTK